MLNRVVITGGTGSFGKKFVEFLLKNKLAKKIVLFSRDEHKHQEIKSNLFFKKHLKYLRFYVGDIRDKNRLNLVIKKNDYVVHAAAMKHVDVCEYNPFEAVNTNIIGTQNLVDVCINKEIKKLVMLSTDKAAAPLNLYGATKLAAEKLVLSANMYKGSSNAKFLVVRYGNVAGSKGSVIPLFKELVKKKQTLTITDKKMTRFNLSLLDSCKFVYKILKFKNIEGVYVPKLKSYNILDIASAISKQKKIKLIGIRPGEKIHEVMITKDESLYTLEFSDHFLIAPSYVIVKNFIKKYKLKLKIKKSYYNKDYSSDSAKRFNISELKKIISDIN